MRKLTRTLNRNLIKLKKKTENDQKNDENTETEKDSENKEKEPEAPKEPEKPKYRKVKTAVELGSSDKSFGLQLPSEDDTTDQQKLLQELEDREIEKQAREQSVNSLESFIYDMQDKLNQEGGYKETVSEADSLKIATALSAGSGFIWDVEEPSSKIFTEKLQELKTLTKDWLERAREYIERPKLLAMMEDHFNHTKYFISAVKKQHEVQPEDDKTFTDKEVELLVSKYEEVVNWKNETIEKQNEQSDLETPVFTEKLVFQKAGIIEREVTYMAKKAKNWKPKPPPKEEKTNETVIEGGEETLKDGEKDENSEETSKKPADSDSFDQKFEDDEKTTPPDTDRDDKTEEDKKHSEL